MEKRNLDVSMFTEPPDGLLEPEKHERRTCVARGACTVYTSVTYVEIVISRRDQNESDDELPVLHILRLLMLRRVRPLPSLLLQHAWYKFRIICFMSSQPP